MVKKDLKNFIYDVLDITNCLYYIYDYINGFI